MLLNFGTQTDFLSKNPCHENRQIKPLWIVHPWEI